MHWSSRSVKTYFRRCICRRPCVLSDAEQRTASISSSLMKFSLDLTAEIAYEAVAAALVALHRDRWWRELERILRPGVSSFSCCGVQQGQDAGHFDSLIYRALHNLRYAITNPAAMPSPSAIFATHPLR